MGREIIELFGVIQNVFDMGREITEDLEVKIVDSFLICF